MTVLRRAPASRLDHVRPSRIRVIFDRAAELERAGERVIHFEIGRPDFDTPQVVKDAAAGALDDGLDHYGPNAGLVQLRESIAAHLRDRNGLRYRAADEVLVTVGANEAVFLAITAFAGPVTRSSFRCLRGRRTRRASAWRGQRRCRCRYQRPTVTGSIPTRSPPP